MDAGSRTLAWLMNEGLQVDPAWSVRTPRGFRWWPHKHAQTIEVIGRETGPHGEDGYLISVRTDLLRSVSVGVRELEAINVLMCTATMAGLVYDETTHTLSVASLVRVYDLIADMISRLTRYAALLQIDLAEPLGPILAEAFHAEDAVSGPPGRGLRPEPDEMAQAADTWIIPMGALPSKWIGGEFEEITRRYLSGPPALLANAAPNGLTVEFPYGTSDSSLCQFFGGEPHPRYGNGLLILQSFPFEARSDAEGIRLALSLNRAELTEAPFGYGFGSYAYRDRTLHFTGFLPNLAYELGILANIVISCTMRARVVSTRLTGVDWTPGSFSPQRSSFGRFAQMFDDVRAWPRVDDDQE